MLAGSEALVKLSELTGRLGPSSPSSQTAEQGHRGLEGPGWGSGSRLLTWWDEAGREGSSLTAAPGQADREVRLGKEPLHPRGYQPGWQTRREGAVRAARGQRTIGDTGLLGHPKRGSVPAV